MCDKYATFGGWYFCIMQHNNIMAVQKFAVTLGLMIITCKPLELDMWNLVPRQTERYLHIKNEILFVSSLISFYAGCWSAGKCKKNKA